MKKIVLFTLLCFFLSSAAYSAAIDASGFIKNEHGEGINEVHVNLIVNNKNVAHVKTASNGSYVMEANLPDNIKINNINLKFKKTTYKTETIKLQNILKSKDRAGNTIYAVSYNHTLQRVVTPAFWISLIILISIFALISLEVMHRTLAALTGASLLLFISYTLGNFSENYFIISFDEAVKAIDFNVIFLLMGMMIIVGVMKKTGVFQWLAYKSYELSKGNVFALSVILMFVTAITSAFLDNVTTMLLLAPISIEIALILNISPFSLLMPEVLASNIGGTATLIGDPPNIMIGSYAHLTFNQFVFNLTPVIFIILIISVFIMKLYYGKEYKKGRIDDVSGLIKRLRKEYKITDKKLLKNSLFILLFVILLFITHGILHMEPSVAALTGAAALLVLSGVDIVDVLEKEVEWPTLVFFMMLFIIVGSAEETGIIGMIATWVKDLAGNSLVLSIILIVWVSAIASAFVDNIPFTATMLPVVAYLSATVPNAGNTLWWALSLGACLGGNGTLIGASANVVTAGFAERSGFPMTFNNFIKVGMPVMIISVAIATVWLLIGG